MTECDVGRMAARRSGGLDSRARAVLVLPLSSCECSEEQRSAVTATAWRPLSPSTAEQAFCRLVSAFRARIGRAHFREGLADTLELLAAVALAAGDARLAARTLASAEATRQLLGVRHWNPTRHLNQTLQSQIHAQIGAGFAAEWAEGAKLNAYAAFEHVTAALPPQPATISPSQADQPPKTRHHRGRAGDVRGLTA